MCGVWVDPECSAHCSVCTQLPYQLHSHSVNMFCAYLSSAFRHSTASEAEAKPDPHPTFGLSVIKPSKQTTIINRPVQCSGRSG